MVCGWMLGSRGSIGREALYVSVAGEANPFRKEQYANRETRILASLSYRLLNQDLNLGPPD